jgi:anti-sigma B factor antagonist
MDIFESRKNDWFILGVKGRMDAVTAPLFREKMLSVIEQGERQILIDCSSLDYVSSAGLRVLFEAAYRILDISGKIGCYGVSSNVKKIFSLADLISEIEIFNSQEDAVRG